MPLKGFNPQDFLPKAITSEEMAVADENSTALGVPRRILMENAGAAVARVLDEDYEVEGKRVLVVAGTGNNGGDGFVAARHLRNRGAQVCVCLVGSPDQIRTEEARANWGILTRSCLQWRLLSIQDSSQIGLLQKELRRADVVVDALLGTGFKGKLREPIRTATKSIITSRLPVVAVDTPTGLDPSTGDVEDIAVKADVTVTFHRMKTGFHKRKQYTGRMVVADIGIPLEAEVFTGPGDVGRVVKPRPAHSHKGDYGYVLIIGGCEVYSGAPALAAMAALKTGAGLTYTAVPSEIAPSVRSYSPDLIVNPLPGGHIVRKHIPTLKAFVKKVDAVILGPGIGLDPNTKDTVVEILNHCQSRNLPAVVDADGLKALANREKRWKGNLVLTPHAGEFRTLSGVDVADDWQDRVPPAVDYARRTGCTLALKGHETIVTDGRRLKINEKGNPGMATGGTGDVLSGIIGAFLAQKADPFLAVAAASYINGAAGDLAYAKKGYHITASDILQNIPEAMKPFDATAP